MKCLFSNADWKDFQIDASQIAVLANQISAFERSSNQSINQSLKTKMK